MAYQTEGKSIDPVDDVFANVGQKSQRDLLVATIASENLFESPRSGGAEVIPYPNGGGLSAQPVGGVEKRAFDIVGGLVIVALVAPLLVFVAFAIKALCRGPIVFAHKRIGFRGKEFHCFKFRTMVVDADQRLAAHLDSNPDAAAEWARDRKLRNDPRVTWIGNILRKTSLDELPQLVNVVRGDMSLVGPRPVVAEELSRYGARRLAYLSSRPGMTGLWQVSGRNSTTYERRTELDEDYVKTWSLKRDLGIILRTIPEMLPSSRTS